MVDLFNEKMVQLQAEGYDEKKLINAKKESNKLKDLTYLKTQNPPGPFSTIPEIDDFLALPLEKKRRRLCSNSFDKFPGDKKLQF